MLDTLTIGPDGNVWFVDVNRGQVGRISPRGDIAQFMLSNLAGGGHTLVAGRDGNVWVIVRGSGSPTDHDWLVRVTPTGSMTRFAAGDAGTALDSITTGPDGNLWFTQTTGGRIGRMTPSGTLTEFEAPAYPSHPRGITTGPEGELWFTDESTVGRMTITGEAKFYPVGNDPSKPLGDIVAGPDGNVWFASNDGIRWISPANGGIAKVQLPSGARPSHLVVGPDRNIWFTDIDNNAIARMSVSGSVREFPLARDGASPAGIAVGADGRLWFAESGLGRIASIGVRVPEVRLTDRLLLFNDSTAKTVNLRNTGDASLSLTGVRVTGVDAAQFTKTTDTCSGKALVPDATCQIALAYRPTASRPAGVLSGYLELTDNASGSPQKIALVGQAPQCQLPIVVSTNPGSIGQPKFVNVRTGETFAPAGDGFELQDDRGLIQTIASPVLHGWGPGYFERKSGRFVPAPSSAFISPDGSRYVYVTAEEFGKNRIHVVDVGSGRDRVVSVPDGFWSPVAFTAKGIYLHQSYEGLGPGVSLLDPDTGVFKTVLAEGQVHVVSGTTAWMTVRNRADNLPEPPTMGGASNMVVKRDLESGATTTWLYLPGTNLWVYAVANGVAVVGMSNGRGANYYLVAAPNKASLLELPLMTTLVPQPGGFVGTSAGVWIGTPDGIYLWTARTGAVLMSTLAATPAGTCS